MNAKLSPAKMVGYVQTLLLTIPVSAQGNSWEEIVNTVSIHIYVNIYICIYIASVCIIFTYYGIWVKISNNLLPEFIIYQNVHFIFVVIKYNKSII